MNLAYARGFPTVSVQLVRHISAVVSGTVAQNFPATGVGVIESFLEMLPHPLQQPNLFNVINQIVNRVWWFADHRDPCFSILAWQKTYCSEKSIRAELLDRFYGIIFVENGH